MQPTEMQPDSQIIGPTDTPLIRDVPILRLLPPAPRDLKGVERELPYILRGRDEEFSHLMSAVIADGATAYAIEGPPGTGKTALLNAVCAYAGQCGYTVMKFDASETNTTPQVIKTLWEQFSPHGKPTSIAKKPFKLTSKVLDLIGFDLPFGLEAIFEAIESTMENLQQCVDLYHVQNRRTEGFIFVFDNAATWRDIAVQPKDDPKRMALKALCNALHDLVRYMEPKISTLMLIAGTPGTVSTFEKLTGGRISVDTRLHMQGVTDHAVHQIITDHLRLQQPNGNPILTPDIIPATILDHAVQNCEGNVWHATRVGQRLQSAHVPPPTQPLTPKEIELQCQYARYEVYDSIITRILEDHDPEKLEAFAYIAAAALQRDNRLKTKSTKKLLQNANAILQTNATLKDYVQWGLIEFRHWAKRYAHRNPGASGQQHYLIPIPSLASYILDRYPDEDCERAQTVADLLRDTPDIPAWSWRNDDDIALFPDLPEHHLHNHVRGQSGSLHPEIPGDRDITLTTTEGPDRER